MIRPDPGTHGGEEFDVATAADPEDPKNEEKAEADRKAGEGKAQTVEGAHQAAVCT